jgi:4-amino-4-deoxy-L-arabinose transferase-like glycosyltransferase
LTPFHTRGEPREAVVVQDLVARGDWILPRRNATVLPRKPPLFYWLGGAVARARGVVDEAGVRLPSALLSGAAVLLLTAAVALTLTPRAALIAGLALLTSFEWLRAATAARVDMTLAFGLTLAFVGLLRFRLTAGAPALALFYTGVTWATLAKGIPGLAIPAIAVALLCLLDRGLGPLRQLRPLRGGLVVLLVVGAR